jgi:aminomethyltransferase
MIAVQGPRAVAVVGGLCPPADAARIAALKNYTATTATVADSPAAVSRTGYTGEDGVELVVPAAAAAAVWSALHVAGTPHGLRACGLGARDTLRLEAGMPLYGHELTATSDPFAIGLGLAFHFEGTGGGPRSFPGSDTFRRMRDAAAPQVRVGIVFDSRRSAREGAEVRLDGRAVGRVTSGSYAPTVGSAVAMALVDRAAAAAGTALEVMIRDTRQPGRVAPLPFYQRPRG